LVDSIGKKIKVVNEVAEGLALQNVKTTHGRVEEVKDTYDFIVSRAVAQMETFVRWTKGRVAKKQNHDLKNGILYLKGGDLSEELKLYTSATIYNLSDYFDEDFYETKKVVHLGMKFKG
jgi:16S rRNA (guanine527-N7)-methyltransferase